MTLTVADAPARPRLAYLDKARGLAMVLMLGDHLAFVTGHGELFRVTAGRLAMPLFFVIGGTLVRRLSPRLLPILAAGLVLPVVVGWVDSPNVLALYVAGAAVIVACRRVGAPMVLPVIVALTLSANGWAIDLGTGYDPAALVALMCVGAMVSPRIFTWADRLPAPLAVLGRYPLSFYLGHLLLLQLAASLLHGSWLWWEGSR